MDVAVPTQTIVGIGSPHGPDQAGWIIVNRLHLQGDLRQTIRLLRTPIEILDHLDGCEFLVIVDACQSGAPVGSVVRLRWPDPRIINHQGLSSHGWGIGQSLLLAEQLGRLPPTVVLYGLEVGDQPITLRDDDKIPGIEELERCVREEFLQQQIENPFILRYREMMHEYSLVRGLLRQIEELRCQQNACSIVSVRLMIGEFSGVEADLLQTAFVELSAGTSCESAAIVIVKTELSAKCQNCGMHFLVKKFHFICPTCQSTQVLIEQGDELILESVTFESRA